MSGLGNGHPRELLSDYLDDELGFDERASVDRHLAGCEDCRVELAALRRVARALAEENVPPVPDDLVARIGQRLDIATVVRPRRWRFALPATIAATLGAIGLLVALQWREGRIVVPTAPAPAAESKQRELDKAMPSYAPAPPREKAEARTDALQKDLAVTPEQKPERNADNAPAAAPTGVPGGIISGVVGGVEGGVAGGAKEAVAGQVSAADERRERAAAKIANEAPMLMKPAPPPAAKSEARSVCEERWSDSGLRATWEVANVEPAVQQLNIMARAVGGTHVWRGIVEGGAYVLVVPRASFEEVFFALRARGMTGLGEPPTLGPGNDCAGISIVLAGESGSPSPSPR